MGRWHDSIVVGLTCIIPSLRKDLMCKLFIYIICIRVFKIVHELQLFHPKSQYEIVVSP
jgi:hypothetical protein